MHGTRRSIFRLLAWTLVLLAWSLPSVMAPSFAADPATTPAPASPISAPPVAISAARQATNPYVLTIKGPIDAITARSMKRRMADAVAAGADALVIELDTPGGELGAVLEISSSIKNSPIRNTVAWINPQAYSGGAIIALACREIVVAGSIGFGDAKVIRPTFDRNSLTSQLRGLNEDERQKLLPPLLADVVDSARRHNRANGTYQWDELIVQAIVATDAELWWVEDTQTGTRFAVDRAEFEALFPDQPVLQPMVATASVGSNEKKTNKRGSVPAAPPADAPPMPAPLDSESAPIAPATPTVTRLGPSMNTALELAGATPTLRPRTDGATPGRFRLLAKICNGDGAVVLRENEMAYFGFASNATRSGGAAPVLQPINSDADLQSFIAAPSLTRLDESWSEEFARFMSAPWVRGTLVTIFLICLFIEFFSPGVTIPGVIALCCLAGLFLPQIVIGMAMWWQLAAIGVGVVFLAAELIVLPGFGIAGLIGIVALMIGLVGVFIPGSSGSGLGAAQFREGLATGVTTLLLAGFTTWVALFFIYRNITNIPILQRLVLQNPEGDIGTDASMLTAMSPPAIKVGAIGVAVTPLRPSGKIEIDGTRHDVVAELGFIDIGKEVRVVSVTDFRISVEAV
jgi:membrane-bound serine protease (ClpP class)